MAPIAQWLERMDQEAGGPGFNPHLVELGGLRVRPFKVSGGSPRPPPEQTPVVKVKTPRVSKSQKEICVYIYVSLPLSIYIYIYIYTYVCIMAGPAAPAGPTGAAEGPRGAPPALI